MTSQACELELIQKTTVDAATLTFANGPGTRFANTANGRTHQQSPLTTYRGYQYVTYYNAERRVCIGRRKLPHRTWEIIQFLDHKFKTADSHNTAVLGICAADGTIHMAFDHHATQLNYRVSKLGVANEPDSVKWEADLFGGVTHTLGSVTPAEQVTYPRFFPSSNGNLMLYYRAVTSGNGDGMLEEYDGDKHDWSHGLGKFIARDRGAYTTDGKTSLYRCPYMNSLSYAGQRLHASWVWRDRFEKTNPRNQHDLCYVYSDDHGRTWLNSSGEYIGRTGTDAMHLYSPGLVVETLPCNWGLANQNTHYAYADGGIHVVMRHRNKETGESCYHHHWRNASGAWSSEALPFTGDRPKLVGTQDRTLILAYTNDEELFIAMGTPLQEQIGWQWTDAKLPNQHSNYGDVVLDLQRWEQERILSIYSQDKPARELFTRQSEPTVGLPSPLNVVDYHLRNLRSKKSADEGIGKR